jgi:HEPN domain-containing protein
MKSLHTECLFLLDDDTRTLSLAWLGKAKGDIAAARKLLQPPDVLLENAVYHCQQAAEKSIKAILALHGASIPMTHDVAKLIRRAKEYEPALVELEDRADFITPYATEYRYSDFDAFELSLAEVNVALEYADDLIAFATRIVARFSAH